MGQILSSNTVYAVAYLTETGRNYLFDPMNSGRFVLDVNNIQVDLFKIKSFSMSDPDVNYNMSTGILLESGDVINITGKNEGAIKGTIINKEVNLISVNGILGGTFEDGGGYTTPQILSLNFITENLGTDRTLIVDLSNDFPITTTDEFSNTLI